ncbi:helix-turn-helix transcriptional regulator [Streptomyces sporangiiformans]|uniref:Helix-turn-helix transcriptional regulator n=1 Tax=Streptomyces sporangiiformans TaxID=2315329 RepID=A0A505D5J2_9ACTN|nr:helix-turn-helix transcriptional regulator [Streptomyces sporangiiformans]TPQ19014.1 helix-turn-helix transcriptional regulator [Streptomyces sporangiiformans]
MNHSELAAYLKSRRARIRPSDVGLPTGPRRRVPGLRREEVAQLAGLSADYYTELERGRGTQPSAQVLAALARALRLNGDERDHLFHLAGRRVPPAALGPTAHVQPGLLGLLDQLTTTPAQVITDLHETLVQNPLAAALVGRPPAVHGPAASFVYRWFTDPDARSLYPAEDHPHHSRVFVADLQAVAARRGRDAEVNEMVAALRRRNQEFADLWDTRDVGLRRTDHKRIVHATLGVIELDCHSLFSEDGRQRLLWFSAPPGTEGAAQLQLLSVIGTQDMTPSANELGQPRA